MEDMAKENDKAEKTTRKNELNERATTPAPSPSPRINPLQFAREVRQEGAKVTWPTRKETLVTTGMVIVMVIATAIFFFVADQILAWTVGHLLLGRGA
jgi:preprotein translocase subunit SecE